MLGQAVHEHVGLEALALDLVEQVEHLACVGTEELVGVLAQAQAALSQTTTNLRYTRIVSPIAGIVVDRQYDVGQTVAASFQAPTVAAAATTYNVGSTPTGMPFGPLKAGMVTQGMPRTFQSTLKVTGPVSPRPTCASPIALGVSSAS